MSFYFNYHLPLITQVQEIMQNQRIEPVSTEPQVTLYKGVFEEDKVEELIAEGAEKVDMYLCKNGEVVFLRCSAAKSEEKSSETPKVEEKEIDLEEFMKGWSSDKWKTKES